MVVCILLVILYFSLLDAYKSYTIQFDSQEKLSRLERKMIFLVSIPTPTKPEQEIQYKGFKNLSRLYIALFLGVFIANLIFFGILNAE